MKILKIVILSVIISFTEAITFQWLAMPLVIFCMNKQAEGFFGIFRRRQPQQTKSSVRKESPEGPVSFASPNFSPQSGMNFFNPYANTPFSDFQNVQGFQGGFRPRPPTQQSWFPPNQNMPSQSMMQQSNSMGQNFDSEQNFGGSNDQGFPSEDSSFESGQMFGSDGSNFGSQGFDRDMRFDDQPPAINTEEAESFFTLLAETDENKCISRLVCEMGADPSNAGELGTTVNEIIGSLTDFPPGTKVSEYNEILRKGRSDGISACVSEYPSCDEETYQMMKSTSPDENPIPEGN